MSRNKLYVISLALSLPMILFGAIIKLQHLGNSTLYLTIGLLFTLVYFFIAITDLLDSNSQTGMEKILWITGLLMFNWLTGVAYYLLKLRANPIR